MEINFNINSLEANAMQNMIAKERERLKEPDQKYYEKVVLYWYQARDEKSSQVGDKGIVEDISPKPVKIIFSTNAMKSSIIHDKENPFLSCYVVDLNVESTPKSPLL